MAGNKTQERRLTISVDETDIDMSLLVNERAAASGVGLHIQGYPAPSVQVIPLSRSLVLHLGVLEILKVRRLSTEDDDEPHVQFITAESLESKELISLWDKVALTPNEGRVLSALRVLDDDIERIAAQVGMHNYYGKGGFIVKIKGQETPIPIGTLGDGMWRMLALAVALAHSKGGLLLVDEIDTGLHYTVMANMWRLIFGAAKELDVQVFATTHSSDCIKSLADLCYSKPEVAENVALQRIEKGKKKSVPYTAAEIEIAAEREIEVR